jgi:hypothetical protein
MNIGERSGSIQYIKIKSLITYNEHFQVILRSSFILFTIGVFHYISSLFLSIQFVFEPD